MKELNCLKHIKFNTRTDLRNFLFGDPGQGGHDLCSFNIQRGRDHGLPDYNMCRLSVGLDEKTSFDDISDDQEQNDNLKTIYDDVNDCDPFVCGILEKKHNKCSMLGELFHKVCIDQFERMRKGDRYWYQHRLNRKQIAFINNQKLSDIIKRNTELKHIPCNAFNVPYILRNAF